MKQGEDEGGGRRPGGKDGVGKDGVAPQGKWRKMAAMSRPAARAGGLLYRCGGGSFCWVTGGATAGGAESTR